METADAIAGVSVSRAFPVIPKCFGAFLIASPFSGVPRGGLALSDLPENMFRIQEKPLDSPLKGR